MSSAKAELESDIWVGLLIANNFLEHNKTSCAHSTYKKLLVQINDHVKFVQLHLEKP
jgi:hypothetical protein